MFFSLLFIINLKTDKIDFSIQTIGKELDHHQFANQTVVPPSTRNPLDVDIVYAYVDGSDPVWAAKKAQL